MRVWESISMAPDDETWCAVRRVEGRVRTVGCCCWVVGGGLVKGIVVLSRMMAFDAVDSVWLPITIVGVSLSTIWLPIWSVPLGYWTAVIVVEPRSRTASGRVGCADEEDRAGSPCEEKVFLVSFAVSLNSSSDEYV